MTHPVIARRRAEQKERIDVARRWAKAVAHRLDVTAVVVFGSTARGDFNKWSDIDVLVIASDLPQTARGRLELLMTDTPAGLQPVGWTEHEYRRRRAKRDPIAHESEQHGVVIYGALPVLDLGATDGHRR